jgi:ribose 5-phosphate isomerase B
MKYYIGADHAGIEIKKFVKELFEKKGHTVEDLGPYSTDRVDYPDYASKVCEAVLSDEGSKGILICGSGIGMSMAANKFDGIRAALCHNEYSAKMAREHNDANVLCMGERVSGYGMVEAIVDAWDSNTFQGGRHEGRVEKINALSKMGSCRV